MIVKIKKLINSFFTFSVVFIAQEIVDKIKKCKSLETLRLEGNTLGVEAAKVISDALKDKPTFKVGNPIYFC